MIDGESDRTTREADLAVAIMERNGVSVEVIRAVDHQIATGVYPDMTEHGWDQDDWPQIFEKVMAADILVLLSPIWLGEKSSVCTQVIERLYGNSHLLNEAGQWAYYGRVGGCMITGNEDGAKHCAMNILYSLQHLGYVIPPQADSGWLGDTSPGARAARGRARRHRPRAALIPGGPSTAHRRSPRASTGTS
jgi:multimeric flavodoxin WrbA